MVRIEAIIRQEKFEDVKDALQSIGVIAMTVDEVYGCGHQAGHVEHYRGLETHINLLPKIRITTVVNEVDPEKVVDAICEAAYTGEHGDGKIFIMPLLDAVRIRTRERGGVAV
ncbi:MAG TPA: P-II family nitrogen regulator [Armatimonadota bacterium]|nr:P-II family nitrogen regulator [Armatimonadota bacterium]